MADTSLVSRETMSGAPEYLMDADDRHYFPHGHVPILDADLVDADYEPDGVTDFMRDLGASDLYSEL